MTYPESEEEEDSQMDEVDRRGPKGNGAEEEAMEQKGQEEPEGDAGSVLEEAEDMDVDEGSEVHEGSERNGEVEEGLEVSDGATLLIP